MIDDDSKVTMIDFPQMTSTSHVNADFYFNRDVDCVQRYFIKNYGMVFDGKPILEQDITKEADMDQEVKASGFIKDALGDNATEVFNLITAEQLGENNQED